MTDPLVNPISKRYNDKRAERVRKKMLRAEEFMLEHPDEHTQRELIEMFGMRGNKFNEIAERIGYKYKIQKMSGGNYHSPEYDTEFVRPWLSKKWGPDAATDAQDTDY